MEEDIKQISDLINDWEREPKVQLNATDIKAMKNILKELDKKEKYRDLYTKALNDVVKESKKNIDSIPKEAVREYLSSLKEKRTIKDNGEYTFEDLIDFGCGCIKELLGE